ncbi:MAG: BatA domain-containing protein, partial [Planctomycetota bacterium]
MAFLRPNALWALPLVLIPLAIHLIHRRRFQTVPWAAMTFLLVASSSDHGRRKLNRRLLLLVRMLEIAAIVIAMARPIRLQGAGIFDWVMRPFASSSTLVVLLDRSPSMSGSVGGEKILQAATTRLDQLRSQLQPARTIVFDSVRESPIIIAEGREVSQLSNSGPVDSQTDVPGLMARAVDWLRNQDVRDAEIFLCSDLQQSDWRVESAQWSSLRAELEEATRDESLQWRFHTTVPGNDSLPNDWIRATQIAPARPNESVRVLIEVGSNQQVSHTVKASLIAGGNIEEFDITVGRGTGQIERLIDIPNENSNATAESVSVTFSIPPDGNLADNQFHLVLNADRPSIGLVAQEDGDALAAAIEVIGRLVWNTDQTIPQRVNEEGLVGIVWQGQLPVGDEAMKLSEFTQNGGSVLLLPPVGDYSTNEFQGVRWGKWQKGRAVQVADDLEINATSICPPIISNESEEKRAVATAMRQVTLGEGRLLFLGIDATSMNSRFVSDGAAMLQLVDNVVAASGKV